MESNIEKFKEELKNLLSEGNLLLLSMALDLGIADEETEKELKKRKSLSLSFKHKYEQWYSLSMQVIKQVLPDRLDDFKEQYKDKKRKELNNLTYGIADYMVGASTTRGIYAVAEPKSAFPKFHQQLNILKSAEARLESSLYDISEILQADLFDNELEAAKELNKKGFLRGAGAIAGVVLEGHLSHVCEKHGIKSKKKHPSINDFNQLLKGNEITDTPTWRFIQHLGDLRNLCDHNKERDPTKDEVNDLIEGVSKTIKTLF